MIYFCEHFYRASFTRVRQGPPSSATHKPSLRGDHPVVLGSFRHPVGAIVDRT